jgi:hypothetical protein
MMMNPHLLAGMSLEMSMQLERGRMAAMNTGLFPRDRLVAALKLAWANLDYRTDDHIADRIKSVIQEFDPTFTTGQVAACHLGVDLGSAPSSTVKGVWVPFDKIEAIVDSLNHSAGCDEWGGVDHPSQELTELAGELHEQYKALEADSR